MQFWKHSSVSRLDSSPPPPFPTSNLVTTLVNSLTPVSAAVDSISQHKQQAAQLPPDRVIFCHVTEAGNSISTGLYLSEIYIYTV